MVIPDFQALLVIEIFINADICIFFLVIGSHIGIRFICNSIMVLTVPRHLSGCGEKILPRLIISSASGVADVIYVFIPRTCSKINGSLILYATFSGDNVNNATCSICTIGRSPWSFDDFDFIYGFHINDLVDIGNSLAARSRVFAKTGASRVVYATSINQNDDSGIAIDGNGITVRTTTIFAPTIPWVCESNPRNTLNRICHINIVTFFNFLTADDLHVTTGSVIRLFSNRITEFILCLICSYDNCIQCVCI